MQKVLILCLLLSMPLSVGATLFFWTDLETNTCGLHYNSYDICLESGSLSGCNHLDTPQFIDYITEQLFLHRSKNEKTFLKKLITLLKRNSVPIPYKVYDSYEPLAEIKPLSEPAKEPAAPKPLTTSQQKEQVLQYLISLGLARPNAVEK